MYDKQFIAQLQSSTQNIRNFCILAHVDHGKTTLADTLLASNGIISKKMAGKLRYMDSKQEEQERGITMKSSAITLVHKHSKTDKTHLINLIDSPGHVDFSTEVSTAVRLCDGAAILIDVCEGICPQTHAVLRQAWLENLKLVLILNKIDRLITELQMTPVEAYNHMVFILEQFNALVAEQFTSMLLEKSINEESDEGNSDENVEWQEDVDESKVYFSPKYNNVFFASSLDGWGFSINNFAELYSAKLGFKTDTLLMTLWGDYYLNAKTKRIMKHAQANGKKPLFVQLILDNLWQVYDAFYTRRDTVMMEKIMTSLNIKLAPRELKFSEPKAPVQAFLANWLPLGKNVLDMIVEVLPSPAEMTSEKAEGLISSKLKPFKTLCKQTQELKDYFMSCKPDAPTIAFISKMFAADKDCIAKKPLAMTINDIAAKREAVRLLKEQQEAKLKDDQNGQQAQIKEDIKVEEEDTEEQGHEFMAFARVFSGSISRGQTIFVLSPRHNPEDFVGKNISLESSSEELQSISKAVQKFEITDLYLMMGRELEPVDSVPSGNIVAIGGLKNLVLKSATLSTSLFCPSFTGMNFQTTPILRVAIEPKNPSKMKEVVKGLKLLNQADPCVEISVLENGEHILCTAGEVHLQKCLDDLVKQFAKVEVNVSPPIIPFKETIIKGNPKTSLTETEATNKPNQTNKNKYEDQSDLTQAASLVNTNLTIGPDGRIELYSLDKKIRIWVKAKPLPEELARFLEDNSASLKLLNKLNQSKPSDTESSTSFASVLSEFRANLRKVFAECQANDPYYKEWDNNLIDRIVSFGPNRTGSNLLIDSGGCALGTVWNHLNLIESGRPLGISSPSKSSSPLKDYENNIMFGFNLATAKGPLCEEPMQGVAFFLDNFQLMDTRDDNLSEELGDKLNITNPASQQDDETKSIPFSEDTAKSFDTMGEQQRLERKMIKSSQTTSSSAAQCITLVRDACRRAFEVQPQRLMAAMYKCDTMTVSSEALGKLYAVLGKRNARIVDETIKEGTTNMFLVKSFVPVADSFGLTEELRKRTSGLATPHIEFSHFEIIDIDPYWEPRTEEELLHYGDKADFENQARKYMNDVRKRKGMFVREKLVEHAEKQRTLMVK